MIFSCYNSDKSHYYSRLDGFSPFSDCAKPKKYFFHRILWCSSQASPTEDEALSDERSAVLSLESLEFCHMDKKQPKTPNPPSQPKKKSHKSIHKPQTDSSEFAPKLMFIPNLLCCFGTKSQNVLHLFHSQHSGDLSCTCWGRLGFLSPG